MLIRTTQEVFDAFIKAVNLPYQIETTWPLFENETSKSGTIKISRL